MLMNKENEEHQVEEHQVVEKKRGFYDG